MLALRCRLGSPNNSRPSTATLSVNGTPLKLFQRTMPNDGSLTFGSNTEGAPVDAHHYIVFVSAPKP
jgi:beta-galactosidase